MKCKICKENIPFLEWLFNIKKCIYCTVEIEYRIENERKRKNKNFWFKKDSEKLKKIKTRRA